jgi:hypothetical protein
MVRLFTGPLEQPLRLAAFEGEHPLERIDRRRMLPRVMLEVDPPRFLHETRDARMQLVDFGAGMGRTLELLEEAGKVLEHHA